MRLLAQNSRTRTINRKDFEFDGTNKSDKTINREDFVLDGT